MTWTRTAMALCAALSVTAARAQAPELPITARYMFPVNVLCGASSEQFQEGVVAGAYRTVIHVLNPSPADPARLAKTVVRTLPYQSGLPATDFVEDNLGPGGAMAIECDELRQRLPDAMSASFRSGYLVLYSDRDIEVSVGYSAGPRGGEIATQDTARIEATELCPFSMSEAGSRAWSDKICLGFSWTCDDPQTLEVALDGTSSGTIPLYLQEDYRTGETSSTFCASTGRLPTAPIRSRQPFHVPAWPAPWCSRSRWPTRPSG
jgi:hypothetical protein